MTTNDDQSLNAADLPHGWARTTIGEITQPVEKVDPTQRPDEEFTYLDISSIDNTTHVIREPKIYYGANAPSRARQLVRGGDVLFSTVRTYLKNIAEVPEVYDRQIASTGFSVLRGKEGISSKYLFYYSLTSGFLSTLAELQRGTSYPAVRDGDVRDQPIPLAPTAEQHRIVAKIEELFTRLDAGIAALERMRANLKRYKAAVLKAACEGKLVPQDPNDEPASELLKHILAERRAKWEADLRAKGKDPKRAKYVEPKELDVDGLPELPSGWCWTTVEQLAEVGTGATPLRSKSKYYEDGTIPWVTSGALNELFVDHAEEYITEIALQETNAEVFPAGSLLVAMYGEGKTRGKVSELRIDAATNQACAALLFDDLSASCKPYVKSFFQKNYEDIRRLSSGGVQPNLNLSLIKRTLVPLPPLAEQRRIVAEVERRLSMVQEMEAALAANLTRAERLRQSILKRAFEGKLVPQDPSDQPAGVLLEKIRSNRVGATLAVARPAVTGRRAGARPAPTRAVRQQKGDRT
jgi:type I restriction enzyme S subunit